MAGGRPTDYKPEYCDQATKLCKLGATDAELAEFFDVCEATINNWKVAHPEFLESIKKGKTIADMQVAEKLYDRACGAVTVHQQAFKLKDTVYENGRKVSETERIEIVDLASESPPDTTAGIFWLKNRKADVWRDKQEHEVTGKNGQPIAHTIKVVFDDDDTD